MFNKYQLPFALLKGIKSLNVEVKRLVAERNDLIYFEKNDGIEISLKHINSKCNFYFEIKKPKFQNGKSIFSISVVPNSTTSLTPSNFESDLKGVITYLNNWINIISEYEKIDLTDEEKIFAQYESEFFDYFEIVDEDASEVPFELDKQFLIHDFLTNTIKILENKPDENNELINEANELKEDLQNLTKENTIKRLSKFLAGIRKNGLILLKEVLNEIKKETYKRVIGGGFDMLGDQIGL